MDIDVIRRQTPGCAERNHLNNAGAALMSETTISAMAEHLNLEARIGGYEAAHEAAGKVAGTYRALASLLGGNANEIALLDNATHAWQAAFSSVDLQPGDEVITGRNEYGSNYLAYLQASRHRGIVVKVIPDAADGSIDLDLLEQAVTDRTKLIGLTYVATASGTVNPADAVGDIARQTDAVYLLDATQAVGQFVVDVAELQCDLLVGTGRKFLRGPRGTGFLWASDRLLPHLSPDLVELASASWHTQENFSWTDGAKRFETWERSYINVLGLGAAVDEALQLGVPNIATRTKDLSDRLRSELAAVERLTLHDGGPDPCAIVTATIASVPAPVVLEALASRGINVSLTVPEHNRLDGRTHPLVRISPHYYNTEDEVDECVAAIHNIVRS